VFDNNHTEYLAIPQVARLFGGAVSYASIRRWISSGVGRPRVKLHAVRIGGQYFTTRQDVHDFMEACKDPQLFAHRKRNERSERAKRRLERAGA